MLFLHNAKVTLAFLSYICLCSQSRLSTITKNAHAERTTHNRQQSVDNVKVLYTIPCGHHYHIIERCKNDMYN